MDRSFTIQEFAEWVDTKDPDETFSYISNSDCPIAQFVKETGRYKNPCVGCYDIDEVDGNNHFIKGTTTVFPLDLDRIILRCFPRTFGRLKNNLRVYLEDA